MSRHWLITSLYFFALQLTLSTTAVSADAPSWSEPLYKAVREARSGNFDQSLDMLEALSRQHPTVPDIRNDYAVVAAWAGKDALTIRLLKDATPGALPSYVLEPYARSLRNQQQWQSALNMYRLWLDRDPASTTARIGLILTLADAEEFQAAEQAFSRLDRDALPRERLVNYFIACGYPKEREGRHIQALDCYNRGLRELPGDHQLLERRALVASALGAAKLAREELQALATPPAKEDAERVALDVAAQDVRWLHLQRPVPRYGEADRVLRDYENLRGISDEFEMTRRFDELIGLVAGYRMQDAVDLFHELRQALPSLESFPVYVLQASGQALLYVEQPEEAAEVFKSAIANLDENASADARFDLEAGLFSALFDSGQFDEAYQLGKRLSLSQEPWLRPTDRLWLENDRYVTAREIGALSDAYSERYNPALGSFDEMLSIAPGNDGLRLSSAVVRRWRGWTRDSRAEIEKVHDERYAFPKAVLDGELALDDQDFARAALATQTAEALHPRGKAALDLRQKLNVLTGPELALRSGYAESDAEQIGSESFYVDTTYRFGVYADHWRPFVHSHYRQADFIEGRGRDHRIGVGTDYLAPFWSLSAEVYKGLEQFSDVGAALAHNWRSTDHLSHSTRLSWNSLDVPLRGVRSDVSGDSISHDTTYRWHESQSISLGLAYVDLDDGNARRSASVSYRQRVLNLPYHKLALLGFAYSSANDAVAAAYYNPERDLDLRVGVSWEWRLHYDYRTQSALRSQFWLGRYQQRRFGSDGLWQGIVEYAHGLDDRLEILLGVRFGRRPYDGTQERQEEIYLQLLARP